MCIRDSWVQNVVRQFGLYLLWAQESCGGPTLVREDRVGQKMCIRDRPFVANLSEQDEMDF